MMKIEVVSEVQETDMEDFTGIVTSTPSWENVSPEASFQSSAVGMMHRACFPKFSWNKVKKEYFRENGDYAVTWEWYVDKCLHASSLLDDCLNLAFSRNTEVWNIPLKDLIFTPINKLKIFSELQEITGEAIIFPVVGRAVVLFNADQYFLPEDADFIQKKYKGFTFTIAGLSDFARDLLGEFDFYLGGDDAEF